MQQNYVCFYSPAFALSRAKRHVRIDIMIHRTTTADHKCCAPLILKNVYELLSFEHHDVLNYNYSITALPRVRIHDITVSIYYVHARLKRTQSRSWQSTSVLTIHCNLEVIVVLYGIVRAYLNTPYGATCSIKI